VQELFIVAVSTTSKNEQLHLLISAHSVSRYTGSRKEREDGLTHFTSGFCFRKREKALRRKGGRGNEERLRK
jgi:hypothetical protein